MSESIQHSAADGRQKNAAAAPHNRYTTMNIKTSLTILTTIQLALIAASIWCVMQADKAMDKAGIGNLELNQQYNSYAGKAISIAVVLWIAASLLAVFSKSIKESYFQVVIAVPPLVLIVSWLLLLLL